MKPILVIFLLFSSSAIAKTPSLELEYKINYLNVSDHAFTPDKKTIALQVAETPGWTREFVDFIDLKSGKVLGRTHKTSLKFYKDSKKFLTCDSHSILSDCTTYSIQGTKELSRFSTKKIIFDLGLNRIALYERYGTKMKVFGEAAEHELLARDFLFLDNSDDYVYIEDSPNFDLYHSQFGKIASGVFDIYTTNNNKVLLFYSCKDKYWGCSLNKIDLTGSPNISWSHQIDDAVSVRHVIPSPDLTRIALRLKNSNNQLNFRILEGDTGKTLTEWSHKRKEYKDKLFGRAQWSPNSKRFYYKPHAYYMNDKSGLFFTNHNGGDLTSLKIPGYDHAWADSVTTDGKYLIFDIQAKHGYGSDKAGLALFDIDAKKIVLEHYEDADRGDVSYIPEFSKILFKGHVSNRSNSPVINDYVSVYSIR